MPNQEKNNIKSNKKYINLEFFIIMIDSINDHIRIKSKIGNYIYSPIDLVKKDDLEFLDFLTSKDTIIYNENVNINQSANSFYITLNIRKEYSYSFFFDIKYMIQEYLNVFYCSCTKKDKINTDNPNQKPNLSEKVKEEEVGNRILVNEKYSLNDIFDNDITYKEYDDMKKIDMYYKSTFINNPIKHEKQTNENERSSNSTEDFTTLIYNHNEKNESDLYFKNKVCNEIKANQLEKNNSQSQFLSKNEEKDELKKESLKLSNSFSNKEDINKFNGTSISIHKEKELSGHFNSVICLLKLSNEVLVSGGYDSNIIIWKWRNGNDQVRQMTLTGHSSSIKCLIKIEESIFASGSYDNTIRLWKIDKEIKNWVCLTVINSYENNEKEAPSSFGLIDYRSTYTNSVSRKLFIYGGTQSNLKMYEIDSFIKENNVNFEIPILPYLEINKRHKKNISQIISNPKSNSFITVSWDKSIKIWNVTTDKDEKINTELVSTIQTKRMIYSACLINNNNDNEKLICGNQFGSISIYDLIKGEVIYDFKFDNESVLTVEKVPLSNGKFLILSGSNNSFVKIFDEEGRVLGKFKAHNNIVYSLLYLDDKYIASCGRESEIIIWKLSI